MSVTDLRNRDIHVFMDGGWDVHGTVIEDKGDRLIITTSDADVMLIFKNKISAITILDTVKANEDNVVKNYVVSRGKKQQSVQAKSDPIDNGDLSDGGVSLPYEVLSTDGGRPSKLKHRDSDDDFSISMTSLFGNGKSRVSVTSDDAE